jgi:hypothetical protein
VSRPDLPVVAPRAYVTGRLVGVCVYLAATTREARRYKDHLRRYLAVGLDVASDPHLWQAVEAAPLTAVGAG